MRTLKCLALLVLVAGCGSNVGPTTSIVVYGHGTVTAGSANVSCGATACMNNGNSVSNTDTITATPASGWHLVSLKADGAPVASGGMASGAGKVVAFIESRFEPDGGGGDGGVPAGDMAAPACMPTSGGMGPPMIEKTEPMAGVCRQQELFIYGKDLGDMGTCVVLGGRVAPVTRFGMTYIVVVVPADEPAGQRPVTVTTTKGTASTTVTVLGADAPKVSMFSPMSARPGDKVTLTGSALDGLSSIDMFDGMMTFVTVAVDTKAAGAATFTVPQVPAGKYTIAARTAMCGSAYVDNFMVQ